MVKTIRTFFFSLTILAFLLFSTIGTTIVYADDDTGTETSTSETTTTTGDEQSSEPSVEEQAAAGDEEQPAEETPPGDEEEQPADETLPGDEEEQPSESETEGTQPVDGEELSTDSAIEETLPAVDVEQSTEEAAPEAVTETILEQVPDNTTVTVLNSEGETLPLVSQESADAIASDYDPIWCPAGQVPTPGLNGCTDSFGSFDELLTFLKANEGDTAYQQAGTIYVQQGDYLGGESEINFNNYDFNNFNQNDLTLQGGWDTSSASPTYTTTNFNVPIIIGSSTNPWLGSLTINNITIDGVSDQTGLTLQTDGVINLNDVEVTNSQAGIDLSAGEEVSLVNVNASDNETYGAHVNADKVAIDTANFSKNGSGSDTNPTGSGLEVNSVNDVALINVTANNNQLFGANIVSSNIVAVEQSTFSGNYAYAYPGQDDGYGLRVLTTGTIAVDGVTADNNNQYGAYLQGGNMAVENSSFTANGSGNWIDPTGYGLQIVGTGEVQVLGVTANDNQLFGTDVKAIGEVTVMNSFFSGHQSITGHGTNWIYYGYGLAVDTPDNIFLNNVTGNFNHLWGASLTGNEVAVYNSQFNNNISDTEYFIDDTGLLVNAVGLVDIWRVEAKENRLFGATITSGGDVFIAESTFTGNIGVTCMDFGCPAGSIIYHGIGLQVTTPGSIDITDTNVDNNRLAGAELNGGVISVANSTFNNNDMGNGLTINATGAVTLTNVTASNNDGNGVEVNGVYCDQIVQVTGGTFSNNILFGLSNLNATLNLDGTQVFGGNGSGDFFNDTSTCIVVTTASTSQPTSPTISANLGSGTNSTIVVSNQTTSPTIATKANPSSMNISYKMLRQTTRNGYYTGYIMWKLRHPWWGPSFVIEPWHFFRAASGYGFGRSILPN